MVVPITNILEKGFDPQNTKDLNLSLLIGPDRLSYLVLHPIKYEVLALATYAFEGQSGGGYTLCKDIETVLKTDSLLTADYARVHLSLHTRRFTLIPNTLYDETQNKLYFQTTMHTDETDSLRVDEVDAIQAKLIYAINNELDVLLSSAFPKAKRNCSARSIINNSLQQFLQEEYTVLALLQARSMSLTILHKGKLLLHQIYSFQNAEDCLYYVMLVYKSLGLSTEKQPILLGGELIQDSEIYKLLHQYIRHISFVERPSGLIYGSDLQRLPTQFYFDLFSIAINTR